MLIGLSDVSGVAGCAEANHFAVDSSPTFAGVLEFFEYQQARAIGKHKAIAVLIERSAGPMRLIITGRKRPHVGESAHPDPGNRRFGSARDHQVAKTRSHMLKCIAHRVGRAGARRGDGVIRTAQPMHDGNVATTSIEHQSRNRHRRNTTRALGIQLHNLFFTSF